MKTRQLSICLSLFASSLLLTGLPAAAQTPPASKTYSPGNFDRLQLGGSVVVRYRQGEQDELVIEGDEAVQRQVELKLRGSRLELRTPGGWLVWMKPRVHVQVISRDLRELEISGAADFVAPDPVQLDELRIGISGSGLARFDQMKVGQLRFTVSGAGEGHFSGQAQDLRIGISGKGEVLAEQLAATRAQVAISGLGKARIWALRDLSISTSGIGTVEYWGSPEVRRAASGVSTINALGAKAAPAPAAAPAAPAAPAHPAPAASPVH